jgi:hypothetical protein
MDSIIPVRNEFSVMTLTCESGILLPSGNLKQRYSYLTTVSQRHDDCSTNVTASRSK